MLELQGVSKIYQGAAARNVFTGIHLVQAAGEYVAIMGESGVGKSTLLSLIAGLDRPSAGSIVFDGQELAALSDDAATLLRRRAMGFVFQAFHLLPHLSVAQNVALPLLLNGVDRRDVSERIAAILAAIGLSGHEDSMPRQLSGGEMQRVAIARAMVHQPRLLLADEPTGNLDLDTAGKVLRLLRSQLRASGAGGILVTHSLAAARTADRILVLTATGLRAHAESGRPA